MSEFDFPDGSHHNDEIPWNRMREAGAKGGIVKVADGYFMPPTYRSHIDPQFNRNWQALDTFDLRGAYVFITFDANRSGGLSPAQQVKLAIDHIGDHKDKDIFALDVEQNPTQISHIPKRARVGMLNDALAEARKYWDKDYVWLYTGKWWWDKQMPTIIVPDSILQHPLWAAYYGIGFERFGIPRGYTIDKVIAHQYSATGNVAGKKPIDLNDFLWDWDDYLLPEPPPPEPPPKTWLEKILAFRLWLLRKFRHGL